MRHALIIDLMTEWASLVEDTPAWQEGRVIGAVLFTSGGGSLWRRFEVQQPEMTIIAEHVRQLRDNMIEPGEPLPPPPPIDPPQVSDGMPRIQYARTVHVVPQESTLEHWYHVAELAYDKKQTIGFSYDDAGIGALSDKTAILWDIAPEEVETYQTWYDKWYPTTTVLFNNFPDLPGPPTAPGVVVDVSQWQGDIDWPKMAEAGVTHAYIRCTIGLDRIDTRFAENVSLAESNGIKWGLYHYYQMHQDGSGQAAWFLRHANNPAYAGQLPPAVDIEGTLQQEGPRPEQWRIWLEIVSDTIPRHVPVIYTSAGYWNSLRLGGSQEWAGQYPLWVAHWTGVDEPIIPGDWDDWWLWQYGKAPGQSFGVESLEIDVNRFNA